MQKSISILVLLALALAACSGSAPASDGNGAAETPAAGSTPAAPTGLPPVATPVGTPTAASGAGTGEPLPVTGGTVYRLVAGESRLTYEVGETFFDQNNRFNVAIGETPEIEGEIVVDLESPRNSQIGTLTADISQFRSDSSRRDQVLRDRFLESNRFPTVTFTPSTISGLPETYTPGEELEFTVEGDVTIRGVTLPVTFAVTAQATETELTGEAETVFKMSDFGFGPIVIAGILGTEDEVKIRLSFLARP